MDRYQFEDLISDYIENQLNLSKRREFEQYLNAHPDAKELVDSVRSTMVSLHNLSPVKTSPDFMNKLRRRIEQERSRPTYPTPTRNTIFGFTPLYAGLMVTMLIALVYVGVELIPTVEPTNLPSSAPQFTTATPERNAHTVPSVTRDENAIVGVEEDSLQSEDQPPRKDFELGDRIQYVKNPR